jgi:hypothetical protein
MDLLQKQEIQFISMAKDVLTKKRIVRNGYPVVVIILVLLTQAFLSCAQEPLLQKKLLLNQKPIRVDSFLKQLKIQTGMELSYNANKVLSSDLLEPGKDQRSVAQ